MHRSLRLLWGMYRCPVNVTDFVILVFLSFNLIECLTKEETSQHLCTEHFKSVGKIGIATENMAIGRAMLSIRNPDLYGYLYFAMNSYKNVLAKQATGAIQKIINNTHLETIYIPLENKNIVDVLNDVVCRIIQIEHNTLKLNELKNNLLPLLINGQLSV